ncbi:MAG: hypothetical protein ICV62_15525, partial [Cyanobacteria bacterium Co-bin13]|nr:hypothetical protein [Cyanobacteria bacterium Co-bin13]
PSKTQLLLASGRPIIASVPHDGTAARAVLRSGGGIVVEPENPTALVKGVLELYNDRAKADRLGQQGWQYALEHYSFEQALERYERLILALAQPLRGAEGLQAVGSLARFAPGLEKGKV